MKILCVFGQHQYGNIQRGESTESFSFVPALKALGHEISLFDSWNKSLYTDFAELNSKFVDECRRYAPEVVLWVSLTCEIWLETLDYVRSVLGVRVVHWAPDDSWKFRQHSRYIARHVDLCVTTYPECLSEYARIGVKAIASGWAIPEPWKGAVLPAAICKYDVTFVGTAQPVRESMVLALRSRGVEVTCFGYGWPTGPVAPEQIPEIFRQSRISLNFSNSSGTNQVKARIFEVTGAGGFLLTQAAPGIEKVFELGREVVQFKGIEECTRLIAGYLDNPEGRDSIARAGNDRTLAQYTYVERLKSILTALPVHSARTKGAQRQFDEAKQRHTKPVYLRAAAILLIAIGVLLFGKQKGPRFARRLCFELSWRIAGEATYKASSIVGRMFYAQ